MEASVAAASSSSRMASAPILTTSFLPSTTPVNSASQQLLPGTARIHPGQLYLPGRRAWAPKTNPGGGRVPAVAAAAADGESDVGGSNAAKRGVARSAGSGQAAVRERSERLAQMQRELLEQLEERRKLHAALLQSMDDPTETIRNFNETNAGGLPPVSSISSPPSKPLNPAAVSTPFKGPSSSIQTPTAVSTAPKVAATPSSTASTPPAPPPAAAAKPAARAAAPTPRTVAPAPPPPPAAKPAAAAAPRSAPPTSSPPPRASPALGQTPTTPQVSSVKTFTFPKAPAATSSTSARAASPPTFTSSRPISPPPTKAPPAAAQPTRTTPPPQKAPSSPPPTPAPVPVAKATPAAAPPPPRVAQTPPRPSPTAAAAAAPPPARAIPKAVPVPAAAPSRVPAPPPPPPPPPAPVEAKVEVVSEREVSSSEPPQQAPAEPLAGPNVMNVVIVASECAPWSKTGGLGDVMGALPKALARRGHRVMAIAPRYGNYEGAFDMGIRKRYDVGGQSLEVGYFHMFKDGVDWVFIDNNEYHHKKNIYEGSREEVTKRMILLCKAAVEAPWHVPCGGICYGDANLMFIANDWHTALLPVYLQAYYRDHNLMTYARCVLVIHNMAHQGRGPVAEYPRLGLPEHYLDKFKLYDPIGGEHMNIFMAGIICAHRVVAVSHGYAWEIQTQMGGWGLDDTLRRHNQKLRGVVNGIDLNEWSPEVDVFLREDGYTNYSADSLEDKARCKAALQRELGLPERRDVPLLGFIGRLDYQKGVDIIGEAMPWIASQDVQLVLLGTGRTDLEDLLRSFEGQHRDKVRAWVGFSVKMAHRITAGCDILLMPSRFEPCGLNQLYAMRYGTVPVVHAVGGLRDTVRAFDPFNNEGLGWTFDKAEAGGLIDAMGNAIMTYREYKDSWRGLQLRGMAQDLSWDNAAQQYEEVMVAAKYTW